MVDSVVMSLWIVLDPMDKEVFNLSERASPDNLDLLYIPQLSRCNCLHLQKWMGSFYAYKVHWEDSLYCDVEFMFICVLNPL